MLVTEKLNISPELVNFNSITDKQNNRSELGNFNSIICTKAIITGLEETLGKQAAAITLINAGRQRGKKLAKTLGLVNCSQEISLAEVQTRVSQALGREGTKLCIVDKITEQENSYQVYTRETICSTNELPGSDRSCTFTLGAIQGFLETFLGQRLRGKQIKSVLRDSTHDVFEFTALRI